MSTLSRSCGFLSLTQFVCVCVRLTKDGTKTCVTCTLRGADCLYNSAYFSHNASFYRMSCSGQSHLSSSHFSLYMEKEMKYYFHIFHKKVQEFRIILSWITRKMKVIHKCANKYKVMSRMNYVNELIFSDYFYICRGTSSAEQPGI